MRGGTRSFRQDKRGITSLEYGLMAALLAVGIIAGVTTFANAVPLLYQAVLDCFARAPAL